LACVFVAAASFVCLAPAAAAVPPPPLELRVVDGTEKWHAGTSFQLSWDLPSGVSPPVATAHYRLKTPAGALIKEDRIGKVETTTVRDLNPPGLYTAEVWLEDGEGAQGPPDVVRLRHDDTRPSVVAARPGPSWIPRNAFPFVLRIDHPLEPLPLAGVVGYAVSFDPSPGGVPCADPLLCSDAEIDLHAGVDVDSLELQGLPEGDTYVHVMAVSGSGVHSATAGQTVIHVDNSDPVTRLDGLPGDWTNRSVSLAARARDDESGMAGGFTAIRVDAAAPTLGGDEVEATVIEEGVHEIAYYARDAAGNVNDGATTNGVDNHPPGRATVRIDRTPPGVAFYDSLDPADPERIRAHVEDALSGGSRELGLIAFRAAGSGDPFQPLPTQASPDTLAAEWDADAYPPGRYEFRATAFDAAGNAAATSAQADGAAMVLANPIKGPTVLSARLTGRGRPLARMVAFSQPVKLNGRLTTGSGRPVADATLRVSERYAGARRPRLRSVGTDSSGRFSVPLPSGPSREVSATFEGSRVYSGSSSGALQLGVRSGVVLRVSSGVARVGGRPVIFTGLVRGGRGELPPGGKTVELEFRAVGLPWQEFRTVYTDRRGRFRYAYRFSDDDSRGVRFRFRAVAAEQQGWPYEPGCSKLVTVLGQ
jgi:hypothetical protein